MVAIHQLTHQHSLQPGALMPATKTAPTWLYDSDHDGDVEDDNVEEDAEKDDNGDGK